MGRKINETSYVSWTGGIGSTTSTTLYVDNLSLSNTMEAVKGLDIVVVNHLNYGLPQSVADRVYYENLPKNTIVVTTDKGADIKNQSEKYWGSISTVIISSHSISGADQQKTALSTLFCWSPFRDYNNIPVYYPLIQLSRGNKHWNLKYTDIRGKRPKERAQNKLINPNWTM